jgi:hypothetical protein
MDDPRLARRCKSANTGVSRARLSAPGGPLAVSQSATIYLPVAFDQETRAMTRDEWIAAFATEIGVAPPQPAQVDAILALAATAAHASERTAAPVATWLAGVSRKSLGELNEAANRVTDTP